MADIQIIKRLHFSKHWSKRKIARELGIARGTVDRVLSGQSTGQYKLSQPRARPVSGPIEPVIRQMLKDEAESNTPSRQRMTAARIEKILERDHGFAGGEASVR